MEQYTNKEKLAIEANQFYEQVDNLEQEALPAANIIVAGITGSGKSTLINAVFGDDIAKVGSGMPITDRMDEYKDDKVPVCIWDTVGLELSAEKTGATIREIKSKIAEKNQEKSDFDRIHAIWYCVNVMGSRYQGAELDFIKSLYEVGVPFIIVLTQCVKKKEVVDEFEQSIRTINAEAGMNDIEIVRVCAKEYEIGNFTIPAEGLDALVEVTIKKLPEFIKKSFAAAQNVSKLEKRLQCEKIIYQYVDRAKCGFFEKIPLVNILTANHGICKMVQELAMMYRMELPADDLTEKLKETHLDFDNTFRGLIVPFDLMGYNKAIRGLLRSKKKEGYEVNIDEAGRSDRVAAMIAFYGYIFIAAIEDLWEGLTEAQLKDIDLVCDHLIVRVNRYLDEYKS